MTSVWADLSNEDKDNLLSRSNSTNVVVIAEEMGMLPQTLGRRLREWRQFRLDQFRERDEQEPLGKEMETVLKKLKSGPMNLSSLADELDLSPARTREILELMRKQGFRISVSRNKAEIDRARGFLTSFEPGMTFAEESNEAGEFAIGIGSDLHAGSTHSQPTAYNRFFEIAYEEYGVRHFMNPGDVTTGLFGYRGQELDIVPDIAPTSRSKAFRSSWAQVDIADGYIPKVSGVTHYLLGGNHDWWHVVNGGVDAVAMLAERRDDMVFLEYDSADLPLTDRANIRLWHPTGGVPYALTYRLQKGVEQAAYAELNALIFDDVDPRLRIMLAGHLHIEAKFQSGPITAIHPGCFEGQTNYLRRKALSPVIGGAILKFRVTDSGLIERTEYTFIPFQEVHDDWKNWPVPEMNPTLGEKDEVDPLFVLEGDPV